MSHKFRELGMVNKLRGSRKSALLCSVMVLQGAGAGAAYAADDETGDIAFEEIIVTANKRETSLMETPLAISAFNQDTLDRRGIKSARDLAGTLPNVQLGTGSDSGTATTIRGVTSTDFTEVGEGAVSVHLDGFYSPRPQGTYALMYDLERVEVLRGPQGTLFGMNSPGGTINIIPAKPDFEDSFAKVEGAAGSYNLRQVRGVLNIPVSSKFALRGSFLINNHDGMLDDQGKDMTDTASPHNGIELDGIPDVDQRRNADVEKKDWYNNANQWGMRVIGLLEATDWLELTGTYSRFSDQGAGDIPFIDCEQAAGTPGACTHDLRYVNINVPGKRDMTIDNYQLKAVATVSDNMAIEYRLGYEDQKRKQIQDVDGGAHAPAEWSSIGAAQTEAQSLTGYYPTWDESWETKDSRYQTTTHELQFKSTGDSKFQYVGGLFYLYEKKRIRYDMEFMHVKTYYEDSSSPLGFNPDGLPDAWVFDQNKRTTSSKAAFLQLDYRLTEKFNVTAGIRHSNDKKTDEGGVTHAFWWGNVGWYNGQHEPTSVRAHQANDLTEQMGSWAPLGTVMPFSEPNHVEQSWKKTTWRLGAQYFPNDDVMIFGSVATGYKMGGMYELADTCANGCLELLQYDPENVTTYELGYKGTLADGRLRLSLTAFYSDYSDMQNTGNRVVGTNENPDSVNFGNPVEAWTTDNLATATIKGVEVEFDILPWENGRISGYGAWIDTEVTDAGVLEDGYACAERTILGLAECGTLSVTGNSLPFAPDLSFTVSYEHDVELSNGYTLQPYITAHWQSKMFLDVFNIELDHLAQLQESYMKIDASVRLSGPDDTFYFELYGANLTDKDTKNFGGFNQGRVRNSYDAPRTFGVRAGYTF